MSAACADCGAPAVFVMPPRIGVGDPLYACDAHVTAIYQRRSAAYMWPMRAMTACDEIDGPPCDRCEVCGAPEDEAHAAKEAGENPCHFYGAPCPDCDGYPTHYADCPIGGAR